MIEVHGWVVISEAYKEADESDNKLSAASSAIYEKVEQILGDKAERGAVQGNEQNRISNTIIEYAMLNGRRHLFLMGDWNHKNGRWEEVYDLFNLIANVAPGSYGALYVRDDEDSNGYNNSMQVYILKKGQFTLEKDSFFSPCDPTIEEYWS